MTEQGRGVRRRSVSAKLVARDELELRVEKLVTGGEGLARFEGFPVLVARSVPGDEVRVRITERRPGYARGEILEVLKAGDGRVRPRCIHFAECGGCDLQHLSDDRQVELKVEAARETLRRLGGISLPTAQAIECDAAWGYRLRTQLHVSRQGEVPEVGYYARGSRRLVPIRECPVLVPALESLACRLSGLLAAEGPTRVDLAVGDDGSLTCAPLLEGLPRGEVSISVGRFVLDFDARVFFQGHRGLLPRLVEAAVGEWTGEAAYDLYAGVGLFTLHLADRYRRVVAVEGDRVAARYLRRNARNSKSSRIEVLNEAVESRLGGLGGGIDRAVVDPPRSGLPTGVVRALLAARPRRLTYVSCHEATLARDLRRLVAGYRLESLAFLDLFPQTGHLETVAQMRLDGDV